MLSVKSPLKKNAIKLMNILRWSAVEILDLCLLLQSFHGLIWMRPICYNEQHMTWNEYMLDENMTTPLFN